MSQVAIAARREETTMARYGKRMCRKGCGHPVGKGDCHADGFCPPKRGRRSGRGRHWMESSAIDLKSLGVGAEANQRGTAVAGVGGSKAGSHRKKQTKKAA